MSRIDPEAYTEEYFRTSVEGFAEFAASGGRRLSSRMARALDLVAPRAGQRVLDIACGRGEIVLQAAMRGADGVGSGTPPDPVIPLEEVPHPISAQ